MKILCSIFVDTRIFHVNNYYKAAPLNYFLFCVSRLLARNEPAAVFWPTVGHSSRLILLLITNLAMGAINVQGFNSLETDERVQAEPGVFQEQVWLQR